MTNLEELRWVRAFTPDVVPKYLVEQIKHRDYEVDDFYKYQGNNCLIQGKNGPVLNPYNYLFVLADEQNVIKGFVWFIIDQLTNDILINNYSIDKEYWHKGRAVKKLADHMKAFVKKMGLKKIFWMTNYPKHSEKHGFKRSKNVLMEYTEENDG